MAESVHLLIDVAEQVMRFHGNIGAVDTAFQKRPEIFAAVRGYLPVHTLLGIDQSPDERSLRLSRRTLQNVAPEIRVSLSILAHHCLKPSNHHRLKLPT
jgi:hypothetical protein